MDHVDCLHDDIIGVVSDTCIPQVLYVAFLEIYVWFSVAKLLRVIINMLVSDIQLLMWLTKTYEINIMLLLCVCMCEGAVHLWLDHLTAHQEGCCCCFLEQGTLLTLLQSTQLY